MSVELYRFMNKSSVWALGIRASCRRSHSVFVKTARVGMYLPLKSNSAAQAGPPICFKKSQKNLKKSHNDIP